MVELNAKGQLHLPDADIQYLPHFLASAEATHYFTALREQADWQEEEIKVFGKTYAQPRLTALYGNNGKPYRYSNITMVPAVFGPELLQIKKKVEEQIQVVFTTCLLNLYRDGRDSNGWHADNERELGPNPVIASVSLGAERYFHLKHNSLPKERYKLRLGHGSLLLMKGPTQHCWKHQIPKTAQPVAERINLTFRVIP
jgi:alkylated DNA repair dioxygenase AlkB